MSLVIGLLQEDILLARSATIIDHGLTEKPCLASWWLAEPVHSL